MAAEPVPARLLVGIVDRNQLSIDGDDRGAHGPRAARRALHGASAGRSSDIDGHDLDAILDAFDTLEGAAVGPPQMIIADTVKGRGVQRMEGDAGGTSATSPARTTTT